MSSEELKNEAVAFAEWMQRYVLFDYSKHQYKYIARQQVTRMRDRLIEYTAEQLYDMYKLEKNNT